MAENNRELMKKDLVMILNLNSRLNYEKRDDIKKIHSAIMQKNVFKTALGMNYAKRLEQIGNRTDRFKSCVLCGNDLDNKSLICSGCLEKYQAVQSLTEKPSHAPEEGADNQRQFSQATDWITAVKDRAGAFSSGEAKKPDDHKKTEGQKKITRKKAVILGLAIAALWTFVEIVGLGNIFGLCTLAAMGILIYKLVKKQKVRNTMIAMVVFFLLTGIFGNSGSSDSRDIANMLGKTEKQVVKIWGKPDYIAAGRLAAYYDGYYYALPASGKKIAFVTLEKENRSNTLMGISIGDSEEDVSRTMKKKKAVQGNAGYGASIKLQYIVDNHIVIDVYFDTNTFTVKEVDASYS